jgi:hypothetical protein
MLSRSVLRRHNHRYWQLKMLSFPASHSAGRSFQRIDIGAVLVPLLLDVLHVCEPGAALEAQ